MGLFKGFVLLALALLFFSVGFAQKTGFNYDSAWKKVDELTSKKGLIQSAQKEVDRIYAQAKKDRDQAQGIKALIYSLEFAQDVEEDDFIKNTGRLRREIARAKQPAISILYSLLASQFQSYYEDSRYEIRDRTKTATRSSDPKTWSTRDFQDEIDSLFSASLAAGDLLKKQKLETYDPIIEKGNVRYLRPTLYDLLAHRALEYYSPAERDLRNTKEVFDWSDPKLFSNAGEFATVKFSIEDSGSMKLKAIQIYQQLLAFHLNDSRPDALIDADLDRLNFVRQWSVATGNDQLFKSAIENLIARYPADSASSKAYYELAAFYWRLANDDSKKGTQDWTNAPKTALDICERTYRKYPDSEGGISCYNLSKEILNRNLGLQTENVNIPNQPFRSLVTYKNISKVYFRIIRLDSQIIKALPERYDVNYWKKLISVKFTNSWAQQLPNSSDYREHHVEIKIDPLDVGEYLLLACEKENFNTDKSVLAVQSFYVSNISYISKGNEYFVLHRESGKPLAGANVQIWTQGYDSKSRRYIDKKGDLYAVDKTGHFTLAKRNADDAAVRLEITWLKDRLYFREFEYAYYRDYNSSADNETEENQARLWLFTDRAIYRPGQIVYFKGISVTREAKTGKSKIWKAGKAIRLKMMDANQVMVDSATLTINDFGSVSGRFRIPESVMTGSFSIEADEFNVSAANFDVEEYKRPKFYVTIEKPRGNYRVNDSIIVWGTAKAYAGNLITDGKVNYTVRRASRFFYPLFYSKMPPRSPNMEIAHGTTTTDSLGRFHINFKAIPDQSMDTTMDPLFDYVVAADVNDINGETRSAGITVQAGYKTLTLSTNLNLNTPIIIDSFSKINVASQNLSGEFVPALINLRITKLIAPDHLIRERLWPEPDQFIYTEAEYLKYFPHDEYKDEKLIDNWTRQSDILNERFQTTEDGNHLIDTKKFSEGYYLLETSATDSFGNLIKHHAFIQLYDPNHKEPPLQTYSWMASVKKIGEPGEKLRFLISSAAENVYLIQEKLGINDINNTNYNFVALNREKKSFEFNLTENDRGGFGVNNFFVKDNRLYFMSWDGFVPWDNKSLSISFETFRDKIEPGSLEKWKIRIKGKLADVVSAETMLNMYDASLDQFRLHSWNVPELWPVFSNRGAIWMSRINFFATTSFQRIWTEPGKSFMKIYDQLVQPGPDNEFANRASKPMYMKNVIVADAEADTVSVMGNMPSLSLNGKAEEESKSVLKELSYSVSSVRSTGPSSIIPRKNFNETAFFFPDLKTGADGSVSFSFTMPEALTQWKLMALAHTKDLSIGYAEKMVVTQKHLMVQPNAPRFLRDGDTISFSAKIANISDKEMKGEVQLELFDAATNQSVDQLFANERPTIPFIVAAGQSVPVQFALNIPKDYSSALSYRIIAKAGNYSDGEENALPVLPNRMLVTESITLPMNGEGTKTFKFEKLLQSGKSSNTLSQHALTLEYTANPAWYAVQSLPYLIEFPHECSEQTFSRFYANALATAIAHSNPGIKKVWENWKNMGSSALLSNLQKNGELKSALLQETPWVMEAKTEAAQKKNLGLLFDLGRMSNEMNTTISKLSEAQLSNGGFAWFKGGTDDRYITQLILTGIGKLEKMNAIPNSSDYIRENLDDMETKALKYADQRIVDEYNALVRRKADLKKNNLDYFVIQYLYMRSFFLKEKLAPNAEKIVAYYRDQAKQFWLQQNRYMQGMIALALNRAGDSKTATAILASLKENSIYNEELGRYWKENRGGFYWQEAPVETQSLLIEAFSEISMNEKTVNELKTWLLKQKQTNHWNSTKSTADACYALLLKGTKWQENAANAEISVNNQPLLQTTSDGLGYAKTLVNANEVKPDMGNITVKVTGAKPGSQPGPSWGAVYWQYFENLDKITSAATPLSLVKKLYIETNTDKGPILNAVTATNPLKVGDKLKIRIELRVDRDMEYVHLKDMRASSMEPLNVLSEYKWQDGLGYYESTRDASTNFFFSYLPKGTYVFEYPVFITHTGNFSVGLATIQCMYAPEFGSHSEGIRIKVD